MSLKNTLLSEVKFNLNIHWGTGKNVTASFQTTLKQSVSCSGIGIHTGNPSFITLKPATPNTGIVFTRMDIEGLPQIPARSEFVIDAHHHTKIALPQGPSVGTIEHLMAAFSGMGIDNAIVEISGEEVPIMDGSAAPFIFLIECAGIEEQKIPRQFLEIIKTVEITEGNRVARLSPAPNFSIEFDMHFRAQTGFPSQKFSFTHRPESFRLDIAQARTFGFFEDADLLRSQGLALGGSLKNAVVFKDGSILNDEGLRYENECVRHKILDVIGDLALIGYPIKGHFYGVSSGHCLNHQLLFALINDKSAWQIRQEAPVNFSKNKASLSPSLPSFAFAS